MKISRSNAQNSDRVCLLRPQVKSKKLAELQRLMMSFLGIVKEVNGGLKVIFIPTLPQIP